MDGNPFGRAARMPFSLVRPARPALTGALVALLLAAAPALAVARSLGADAPSPARGHAEVIAHGVAPLPAGRVAWRVVADTAQPQADAPVEAHDLGFALAAQEPIVVNDAGDPGRARLAPGEAVFVPNGVRQQRAAPGDAPVSYLRLALVPASEVADAGGGDLVFAGEPFAAPRGDRDIDLVRDALRPGEAMTLPRGAAPILVYSSSARIEVAVAGDGGGPAILAAGEAAAFDGDLTVTAVDDAGAFVAAAIIGPDVPRPSAPIAPIAPAVTPAPTPTAAPATPVQVTLVVYDCPPGVAAADVVAISPPCQPASLDSYGVELTTPAGESLTLSDADFAGGSAWRWGSLPYGDYRLTEPTVPGGVSDQVVVRQLTTDPASVTNVDGGAFGVEPPTVLVRLGLYNLRPAEAATGSLSLTVRACPAGMRPETLFGEVCNLAPAGWAVSLHPEHAWDVRPDAAGDGAISWTGLAFQTYAVVVTALPAGFDASILDGIPGNAVTIDAANPHPSLTLYLFPAAGTVMIDSDGDGLSDSGEAGIGTDLNNADSDGDGIGDGDGDEVSAGTDPLAPPPSGTGAADHDGDGLSNNEEAALGPTPSIKTAMATASGTASRSDRAPTRSTPPAWRATVAAAAAASPAIRASPSTRSRPRRSTLAPSRLATAATEARPRRPAMATLHHRMRAGIAGAVPPSPPPPPILGETKPPPRAMGGPQRRDPRIGGGGGDGGHLRRRSPDPADFAILLRHGRAAARRTRTATNGRATA